MRLQARQIFTHPVAAEVTRRTDLHRPRRSLRLLTSSATPFRSRLPAGFMLVDCLAYIGLLAVLLTMAYLAFYRVSDHSRHLGQNAADIARALNAGERWRKDLRSAVGSPVLVESAQETVLHLPQLKGEVLYAYRDGGIYRRATARTNENWGLLLAGVKTSSMRQQKYSQVSAWRWELELGATQKVARVKPLFTFQAVVASHPTL
jgi:hypothetical protein